MKAAKGFPFTFLLLLFRCDTIELHIMIMIAKTSGDASALITSEAD